MDRIGSFKIGERVRTSQAFSFGSVPGIIVSLPTWKRDGYGVRMDDADRYGRVRIVERPAYSIQKVSA